MKIGLQIPNFNRPGGPAAIAGKLARIAPLETFGRESIPALSAL